MFDELIGELRRLERPHTISVPIAADAEGYLDKECPSTQCLFQFKVHETDWAEKVRDEESFCPFCGHTATSDKWWTQEQIEYAKTVALAQVQQRIRGAMRLGADRWNRNQKHNSFFRITMNVDNKPQSVMLPLSAAEPMRLKITCPTCTCRYAVIGSAFFCPACGHNAADLMFTQAINGIRNALGAISQVRSAIADRDTAETTARLLVENSLQNAVTAFQRYAEILYAHFPSMPTPRRNAFQSLREGSELWLSASGKSYAAYLRDDELHFLVRLFQQRHLLAHTQGVIDDDYVIRTGDATYQVGQRVVIREAAVRDCLAIIEKLIAGMAQEVPLIDSGLSPKKQQIDNGKGSSL